jgi:hypothetical protein
MALPKAVQEIGDAAEAAAVEAGMKLGHQPIDPAGNPDPAAAPIVPQQTATVLPIDPNAGNEDWEKRFKGLVTTHQQIKQQLEQAQATIGTNQQTIATLQQQVSQLSSGQQAPAPGKPAPKTPAEDKDAHYKAWLEALPKSIKDEYAEDYLRDQYIIQTNGVPKTPAKDDGLKDLRNDVAAIKQTQVQSRTQEYEAEMDVSYPGDAWITMASGQDWNAFCARQVSDVDTRTFGEIVKQGSDSHTAKTVVWVLKQYEAHLLTLGASEAAPVAVDPLASQLTPDAGTSSGGSDPISEINAQAQTFTASQVDRFFKDFATTKKYSAEEGQAIEKQIIAAQAAGKIIPG